MEDEDSEDVSNLSVVSIKFEELKESPNKGDLSALDFLLSKLNSLSEEQKLRFYDHQQ